MASPRHENSWASAAAQASFVWFTPIQPRPLHTWAGGFGWDPEGPSTLEVLAMCDGVEVSVAGVRLAGGDRWIGIAKVGDVSVKIITAASVPNLTIGSSTDTSLPESPPP